MRRVPDGARDAMLRREVKVSRLELVSADGLVLASTDEGPDKGILLYATSASVDVDDDSQVERTSRITFVDREGTLRPAEATDLFHPFAGLELRAACGITWDTRASLTSAVVRNEHLWDQGLFQIWQTTVTRDASGVSIDLELDDLSAGISANPWRRRRVWRQKPLNEVLTDILLDRQPGAVYEWEPSDELVERAVLGDDTRNDPFADMVGLASRRGLRLTLDPDGVYRTRTKPDVELDEPVWTYSNVEAFVLPHRPNLVSVERSLNARESYNGIQVEVESPDRKADDGTTIDGKPFRVTVWDPPSSRSRARGNRVERVKLNRAMTRARAQQWAEERLRQKRGSEEQVRINALANPAHEAADIIAIEDTVSGTSDVHRLSAFTVDHLEPGPMDVTTRSRRIRP